MVIQHNIPAINSHRNLLINNNATSKNLEKLSSGYRINRAGDDAAGLAISEKMRGQIRGLAKAEDNASHAINLIQTAEGGLQETHAILQRMRELAVQASNGTYQDDDRKNIALEVEALKSEINRISSSTEYNTMNLLDGTLGGQTTQVAADFIAELGKIGDSSNFAAAKITFDTAAFPGLVGANATIIVHDNGEIYLNIGDKSYRGVAATQHTTKVEFREGGTAAGTLVASISNLTALAKSGVTEGAISDITILGTTAVELYTPTDASMAKSTVGSASCKTIFQIGANGTADQQVGLHVKNMSAAGLGGIINGVANRICDIDISTRQKANQGIDFIDLAIDQVSAQRAELGALQNRLEHTLNNLGVTKENLTAAESTIRDVDMAKEMMEFTKNSILVQASQAMLAQANALPQGVLSLLG